MHKNKPKNFAPEKQRKRGNRTRFGPKKAKPGAFWVLEGMGTVEDGSNQMRKPSVRTKVNHKTMQHMQKENRQKPSVFAGFVAGAEGLVSAAASVGAGRSPQATSAPRHAPQESLRAHLYLTFLAGAEGLEPSARGFGVDVGECSRERGRGRFRPVLPDKSQKSGAGLVLRRNAPKLSEPKRGGQSAGRVYFL